MIYTKKMTIAGTKGGTEQHCLSISGVERVILCQSQIMKGIQEEERNFPAVTQAENQG